MRTLPDGPDLAGLLEEAEELVPHLARARPGAGIDEARTLLAERYGFPTWPELAAEVDRRAASVPIAEDGEAEAVAAAFGLGTPTGPLVARERQWAGQAWTLVTDRGQWLARQLAEWFDEGAAEDEVRLAEAAAAAGIATLRPVRSPADAVVEAVHGSRWRVYELPPLGPEPPVPARPEHAAAAGRILGRVHALALPAPQPVQQWLRSVRTEDQWWNLHAVAAAEGHPWADQLAASMPGLVEVAGLVEVDPGPDVVLSGCHYAPNAFRLVRGSGGGLAVVTWEHAGAISPRWDLGGALASWSDGVYGEVNPPAARALVAGYAEAAPLPAPLDLGMFTSWICSALNWLGTRVQLALRSCDAERREQAARAVPGLVDGAPSPARFQAVLDACAQGT